MREEFYQVHSAANGADWCCCAAWWVPTWEGWGERSGEENRALRARLFDQGEYDGYLLFVDGRPAGWCQCGPRDRLAKLCGQFELAPDPEAWAISCFLIAPRCRGRGLAQRFLAEILADLEARGVRHVQAFPRRGEGLPAEDVWTGPEALYRNAGFELERDDPRRPIYSRRAGLGPVQSG